MRLAARSPAALRTRRKLKGRSSERPFRAPARKPPIRSDFATHSTQLRCHPERSEGSAVASAMYAPAKFPRCPPSARNSQCMAVIASKVSQWPVLWKRKRTTIIGMKTVKNRARLWAGFRVVTLVVFLDLACCTGQELRKDKLPRFPDATLLMGYPPGKLVVTTGDTTSVVQAGSGDWSVTPSISADGHLVASARIADDENFPPTSRPLLTVGIYSLRDKSWRDFRNLEISGGKVAISPDGSRLGCITRTAGRPPRIQLLDLVTGTLSIGPDSTTNAGDIAWSPDGRRIAFVRAVERSANGRA